MAQAAACRLLALMGSGETSPTMVTAHRALVARLGMKHPAAVVLETPYRFQENADDISVKAKKYFARSVDLEVRVLAGTRQPGSGDEQIAALRSADWVFAGPGSPTYALGQWRGSQVAETLRDRVLAGQGVTVFASAAAITIGLAALPVYEIYKAGEAPHWLEGLDLMGALGLKVAIIPHYDNAEGRTHDTRYCYLGERRLALLERELPGDAAVLGIDEHTVAVFDLLAGILEVSGRGGITVRRRGGGSTTLPAGTEIALARLQALVRRGTPLATEPAGRPARPPQEPGLQEPAPLPEIVSAGEDRFEAAAADGDAPGMVAVILDLETAIAAWDADTDEDQGTEQARAVLRSLVARLGRAAAAAQDAAADPRDRLRPAVESLISSRAALRGAGNYPAADAIRDALAAAGLQLRDTDDGPRWEPG